MNIAVETPLISLNLTIKYLILTKHCHKRKLHII